VGVQGGGKATSFKTRARRGRERREPPRLWKPSLGGLREQGNPLSKGGEHSPFAGGVPLKGKPKEIRGPRKFGAGMAQCPKKPKTLGKSPWGHTHHPRKMWGRGGGEKPHTGTQTLKRGAGESV